MNSTELTISEVLRDPMIRLILRADRVPLGDFARLLEEAASARRKGLVDGEKSSRPQLAH